MGNSGAPSVAGVRWRPNRVTVVALAWASLASQIAIIVTGGAVRLTGSGLGCPTFPGCTEDSLTNTAELGVHGWVEFVNRTLTFVLVAVALATLVAVHRSAGGRGGLRRLALVLFLGIPAQALIGGITVLTALNPWVVMLHFMCSALLVAVAVVLLRRVQADPTGALAPPRVPDGPRVWLTRLAGLVWVVAIATLYVGTVVTGSGPHAGDPDARRTGLDLEAVAQLHTDLVLLLVGLSVGLYAAARAAAAPRRTVHAAAVLLGVELAQGAVGVAQYVTDLPVLLVGIHMLGAALLAAAVTDAYLATRVPAPAEPRQSVRTVSPASIAT